MKPSLRPHPSVRRRCARALLPLLAAPLLSACSNLYDNEGDCSVRYLVKVRFDRNLLYADATAHEVSSVHLLAVNDSGRIVWQDSASGPALEAAGHALPIDIAPGRYGLLAWCGTGCGTPYRLTGAQRGGLRDSLVCHIAPEAAADLPPLLHGYAVRDLNAGPGTHEVSVPLTKNTNRVRVVLQHLSGTPLDTERFRIRITDTNGHMGWDNRLTGNDTLTCVPWYQGLGQAETGRPAGKASEAANAFIAELTTGRMVKGHDMRLTVSDETGRTVLSIPLIDYALLMKSQHFGSMADQEYLDRQDTYSLLFFLDEDNRWLDSHIYINSWKVVLQETTL